MRTTTPQQVQRSILNDPIIVALHLRARLSDNLNFIAPDQRVITFDTYEDLVSYWFPIRRDFYAKRIARERGLIEMRIARLRNVCSYIARVRDGTFSIADKSTEDEADAILASLGFERLNVAILSSPNLKYTPDVVAVVRGSDATFAYLMDLRERDLTVASFDKYKAELDTHIAHLARLEEDAAIDDLMGFPFIGARIWRRELDELERAIVGGRVTRWKYDDDGRYMFDDGSGDSEQSVPADGVTPQSTARPRKRRVARKRV